MRTEHMQEFLSLAKNLNFTKTASEFYITQPTLSKHMQLVENEVGVPLFVRNGHDLSLTAEGQIACRYFQKILGGYDDMMREIEMSSTGVTGSIRLGLYALGGAELLETGLNVFYSKYPGIELTALNLPLYRIVQSLQGEEIDIGIIFQTRYLPENDFAFKQLGSYEWQAVVANTNQLASRSEVSLDDLRDMSMVLPREEREYSDLQLRILKDNSFEPSNIIYCNGATLIPSTLRSRDCYFIGMDNFNVDYLVGLPINDCELKVPVGMVYRKENDNPSIPYFLSCF